MQSPTPASGDIGLIFKDEDRSSKAVTQISIVEVPHLIKMVNRAKRGHTTKKDLQYAILLAQKYRIIFKKWVKVPYLKMIQVILRQQEKQVRQHMANLFRVQALAILINRVDGQSDPDIIKLLKSNAKRYKKAKALADQLADYAKSL